MAKSPTEPVILGESHYDALTASLDRLKQLPQVMEKAEKCGVNCDEYRKMLDFAGESLETIRKTWFPKGRPKQ
jgi:hypothetical protein